MGPCLGYFLALRSCENTKVSAIKLDYFLFLKKFEDQFCGAVCGIGLAE
jgi:hypothetical protein